MGMIGPLQSSQQMKNLFTGVDIVTSWPETLLLINQTARVCASTLIQHWVPKFGFPAEIVCDRGEEFTVQLWKELNKLSGRPTGE